MPTTNLEKKPTFDHEENLSRTLNSNSRLEHSQIDVLITRDTCASHISFPKYHLNSDLSKNLSRSTPALEDLYARVSRMPIKIIFSIRILL